MSWTHPARIGWGLFRPVQVRGDVILEVSFVLSLRSRPRPRASPPDHSRITHSRHRTALGGHQRTPSWSISYSRGRRGSLSDTVGHGTDTVRDREAPGSNPGLPTQVALFELANEKGPRIVSDAAAAGSNPHRSCGMNHPKLEPSISSRCSPRWLARTGLSGLVSPRPARSPSGSEATS